MANSTNTMSFAQINLSSNNVNVKQSITIEVLVNELKEKTLYMEFPITIGSEYSTF